MSTLRSVLTLESQEDPKGANSKLACQMQALLAIAVLFSASHPISECQVNSHIWLLLPYYMSLLRS